MLDLSQVASVGRDVGRRKFHVTPIVIRPPPLLRGHQQAYPSPPTTPDMTSHTPTRGPSSSCKLYPDGTMVSNEKDYNCIISASSSCILEQKIVELHNRKMNIVNYNR